MASSEQGKLSMASSEQGKLFMASSEQELSMASRGSGESSTLMNY